MLRLTTCCALTSLSIFHRRASSTDFSFNAFWRLTRARSSLDFNCSIPNHNYSLLKSTVQQFIITSLARSKVNNKPQGQGLVAVSRSCLRRLWGLHATRVSDAVDGQFALRPPFYILRTTGCLTRDHASTFASVVQHANLLSSQLFIFLIRSVSYLISFDECSTTKIKWKNQ